MCTSINLLIQIKRKKHEEHFTNHAEQVTTNPAQHRRWSLRDKEPNTETFPWHPSRRLWEKDALLLFDNTTIFLWQIKNILRRNLILLSIRRYGGWDHTSPCTYTLFFYKNSLIRTSRLEIGKKKLRTN